MKYYHGSPKGDLTKLTTEKSVDGYVWLAEDYCFAVMYAANHIRFWNVDKETGKLIIREVKPNSLELMYKNKPCYIYSVEKVGEFEQYDYNGRKSIRLKHDINLEEVEFIPDAYSKIKELEKQGKLIIRYYRDMTPEQKQRQKDNIVKTFKPTMQDTFERFYEDYVTLSMLFEELKLENINKQNP